MTLVLSRTVKAWHEQEFEDVLHRLAAEVRRQPVHLAVATLTPAPGGPGIYTIVSHFACRSAADEWLTSEMRARLVAKAGLQYAVMPALARPARGLLYPRAASQPGGGDS